MKGRALGVLAAVADLSASRSAEFGYRIGNRLHAISEPAGRKAFSGNGDRSVVGRRCGGNDKLTYAGRAQANAATASAHAQGVGGYAGSSNGDRVVDPNVEDVHLVG